MTLMKKKLWSIRRVFRRAGAGGLLLALVLAAGFAGCSRERAAAGGSAGAAAGTTGQASAGTVTTVPVVVTFWHSMADNAGRAFETFVREFNEGPGAEKNIQVEAVFQGQYADAAAKLRPLLQTGQGAALPDVMQLDATAMVDYLATSFAFTVDDARAAFPGTDPGLLLEAPLRNWNYQNRQLGLPLSASTTVLYYNKTLLDEAGVTLDPAAPAAAATNAAVTFADLIAASRKLPGANANGQKITALALVPNSAFLANWIGQMPGLQGAPASYVVDQRNGRDGVPVRLVCDTEGTLRKFLQGWKELYDAGALLNVAEGTANLFVTGQTAFHIASTSQLQSYLDQIGGRFELGCAWLPRVSGEDRVGAAVSGSGIFLFRREAGAGATDPRLAAAWEFARYMVSPDIQARFAAATGYLPVNSAAFDTPAYQDYGAANPLAGVGFRQLEATSPELFNLTVGPSRDFYYETQNQIAAMLTAGTSPAAAAAALTQALNLLLTDYAEANE